jgi:uncharacterized protein YjbI with pentapeptide repeats
VCALYQVAGPDDDPGYHALLKPGMERTISVGRLQLTAQYSGGGREEPAFGLQVRAGEVQLFRALYQLYGGRPPRNQFAGQHGFTGLLYFTHPSEGGNYQVICRSVDSAKLDGGETREAYLRRAGTAAAHKARLVATLHDRASCAPAPAGARCPAKHPLPERAAALRELHALQERAFPAVDLRSADLAGADVRESDLTNAQLDGANLQGAQLYFDKLNGAQLSGAQLTRANLYSAELAKADLSSAVLLGAKLENATMTDARLGNANLSGAYAVRADLTAADLQGAQLVRANLADANLSGARLGGAVLAGADLTRTILDGADLTGSLQLKQFQLQRACGDERTKLPPGLRIRRGARTPVANRAVPPCAP